MEIRKIRKKDIREVARLVRETYANFNKTDGSKKAVQSYLDFYDVKKNYDKIQKVLLDNNICLVAIDRNKIVGVIRGDCDRIYNLYIKGNYHRRGIGARLLRIFEKEAMKNKSKKIQVKSSLYAINFYQKHGYRKTTGIRRSKKLYNLGYQPMIKRLK